MVENLTILLAEDEKKARENFAELLSLMAKRVVVSEDGKEAYEMFLNNNIDIVILDIEMPIMNGLEVAKKIREKDREVPIIISTAYTSTEYFLEAVELNLTSYILKPISMVDLKNSLNKSLINLSYNKHRSIDITANCFYNINERTLYIDDEPIPLRNNEMLFLEYMLKRVNSVISYQEFENNIWEEGMSSSAIRSLVRDLRKILPENVILNVSKVGYKLCTH